MIHAGLNRNIPIYLAADICQQIDKQNIDAVTQQEEITFSSDCVGFVIAQGNNADEAEMICVQAKKKVQILM